MAVFFKTLQYLEINSQRPFNSLVILYVCIFLLWGYPTLSDRKLSLALDRWRGNKLYKRKERTHCSSLLQDPVLKKTGLVPAGETSFFGQTDLISTKHTHFPRLSFTQKHTLQQIPKVFLSFF